MAMKNFSVSMEWAKISVVSVIAFLVGWFLFGLFAAVVIAVIVLMLMGIIKVKLK